MLKKKIIKLFLIFGVVFLSIVLVGCEINTINKNSNISEIKSDCINELESYFQKIKLLEYEYNLILIEDVLFKSKDLIYNETEEKNIISIKNSSLEQMKNLTLTKQQTDEIKNIYYNAKINLNNENITNKEELKILYYLGKFNDKYVVIMQGDYRSDLSIPERDKDYFIYCKSNQTTLAFQYMPEQISIINNIDYYTLDEAYKLSIILDEDLLKIHYRFKKIYEV